MSDFKDPLGDRMKAYERTESDRRLMPFIPAMARLDGRNFTAFTKGMQRPFDGRFERLMTETCRFLTRETGAVLGYTQSDEITLCWRQQDDLRSEMLFGGRIQKMTGTLAAMATAFFNGKGRSIEREDPLDVFVWPWYRLPTFDCRVWNVPNDEEAANTLLWRQFDAAHNSVQMLARSRFSHGRCLNKTTADLKDMLHHDAVEWDGLPPRTKWGTFVRKVHRLRKYTVEEIERLPPKHNARTNPDLIVERTDYEDRALWAMSLVDRVDTLLYGGPTVFRRLRPGSAFTGEMIWAPSFEEGEETDG